MTISDDKTGHEVGRKEALVVSGMHRSGTSAMTRVLALAGAALPTKLLPPNPTNSEGHWEPLDVAVLNDEIFSKVDSSWDDLFGPRYIRQRKPPIHRYLARARKIIQDNYNDEDVIVLKDPRISIFPDLWHRALSDEGYRVSYVLMVRNPMEVAESLKVRDGFPQNRSLILWATYMLTVDIFTRNKNRIFVNYDDLFLDTESLLDRVEGALKIRMPRRTWASMTSVQDFVNTAQRHHKIDSEHTGLPAFPEIERFYAYLRATSKGEIWNEDVSADLAEWLSRLESATAPVIKSLEAALAANSAQSATRETQLRQDVERLETALSEAAHLSTDLTGQLAHSAQRILALEASLQAAREELAERQASFLSEAQKLNDELIHAKAQNEESEARASAAALAYAEREAAQAAEAQKLNDELIHAKAQNEESEARASAGALAHAELEAAQASELRLALAQTEEVRREASVVLEASRKLLAHSAEAREALSQRVGMLGAELGRVQTMADEATSAAEAEAHRRQVLMDRAVAAQRRELDVARSARAQLAEQIGHGVLSVSPALQGAARALPSWQLIRSGDAANRARDWRKAETYYAAALRKKPSHAAIWVQYGHALKEQGKTAFAEIAYRRASTLAPHEADAPFQLARILNIQGRVAEARESYERALRVDPAHGDARAEMDRLPEPAGNPASFDSLARSVAEQSG